MGIKKSRKLIKVHAIITFNGPGNWTKKGRREVSTWLHKKAHELETLGATYPKTKNVRDRFIS